MSTSQDSTYNEAHAWYSANWDPEMTVGQWWKLLDRKSVV